jgi:hypothetical protein
LSRVTGVGPLGNRHAPRHARMTFGEADPLPDPARPNGWTLLVDRIPR